MIFKRKLHQPNRLLSFRLKSSTLPLPDPIPFGTFGVSGNMKHERQI